MSWSAISCCSVKEYSYLATQYKLYPWMLLLDLELLYVIIVFCSTCKVHMYADMCQEACYINSIHY